MKGLFVTGAPRSGTTLLDKLLSMHPRVEVLSQPLPLLYVELKRWFLHDSGRAESAVPYPLNDMFLADYYPPSELVSFLQRRLIDEDLCSRVLETMIGYDGQYTKPRQPLFFLDGYRPKPLDRYLLDYCRALSARPDIDAIGAKESFCEEFIPYFLARSLVVIQLIRDPRDSITSLLSGHGERHAGAPRPLLFYVRQWRKSAAFALEHVGQPGFHLLRYEDLTTDPVAQLNPLIRTLGLQPFDEHAFAGDLRSPDGGVWSSNSSHEPATRLNRQSVGKHRSALPAQVSRFIEACCYHDMAALGYTPQLDENDLSDVFLEHAEEAPASRPELAHYHWSPARQAEEQLRADAIRNRRYAANLFVFRRAFEALIAGGVAPS